MKVWWQVTPSGGLIVASYGSQITNNVFHLGLNYNLGGP